VLDGGDVTHRATGRVIRGIREPLVRASRALFFDVDLTMDAGGVSAYLPGMRRSRTARASVAGQSATWLERRACCRDLAALPSRFLTDACATHLRTRRASTETNHELVNR